MAAPIRPPSAKAYGREKWAYVPTVANINAPTLAELNAAAGLDISCYLFDSSTRPTQNTNLVTKERRVCDTKQFQQVGNTDPTGGEITYALDPQAAALSDGKKAWEKIGAGATGFLVRRLGIDVNTDFAAGQFVDVFPVEFGPSMPIKVGDGEAAEVGATASFAITADPAYIKAIAA